ncbi:MAG: thioredoxin family protein [Phycisphaeraceae bacterium]|nr:thioredoxin family protein [Phycisphaeraceae bacterium]
MNSADRRRRYWLLAIAGTVVLVVLFAWAADRGDYPQPAWITEWDAARRHARAQPKWRFVYFTADWCPPCHVMKREVFSRADIRRELNENWIPVKVDVTDTSDLPPDIRAVTERYHIEYIPSMLILDHEGNVLARQDRAHTAQSLTRWLKRHAPNGNTQPPATAPASPVPVIPEEPYDPPA